MESDKPSRSSGSNRSWQRGSYRGRSRRRKRRRKPWNKRLADWTRSLIAFLFSNVGIVCLVVGYTIAGAFLFAHIEGRTRSNIANDEVIKLRNLTAATLWELTSKENVFSEKLWKAKVRDILENYQKRVVSAAKSGYNGVEENKWTFAGAFLYSLTVITTIGYGNICPRTKWGKVVTIVYAIIGMPLFLLYLSNIGDILARSFKWIYARCCLCKCRRRPHESTTDAPEMPDDDPAAKRDRWQMVNTHSGEVDTSSLEETSPRNDDGGDEGGDEDDDEGDDESDSYDPQHVTVPLTLCLAIMVGYIWGGAVLFSEWEDWNMLDGSYFCFVSLSTIGFGDIVPGDKIYSGQGLEMSFIFCSMYLMLGMALIAMCFNLMQEEVIAKIRSLVRIIKYIFRCQR